MDCSICCEKFNNTNHAMVYCKACTTDTTACRTCCKTKILNSNSDPSCMFCKTPWEREFMIKNLTKTFVNVDLKKHNEDLFLERQISLLPDTQKEAIKEKKIRELRKHLESAQKEKDRLKALVKEQVEICRSYTLEIVTLHYGTSTEGTSNVNFTIKCCREECNGFLDDMYHCALCETNFCKMCMEIKTDGHVCNEQTKATVQTIKKQAKPCPGCGEMISKIDGCDQMWCVKCHVQFSWRTGQQMEGYNHNPEYFRWLRETGQEIDRNPNANEMQNICGINVDAVYINRTIINLFPTQHSIRDIFCDIYRFYRHVEWLVGTFQERVRQSERSLLELRVNFLLKDVGKEQWKSEIQKIDKQDKKNNMYENIWRLVLTVLQSTFEKFTVFTHEQKNQKEYIKLLEECQKFKHYANTCFINISNIFGSQTCPGISKDWRDLANLKTYNKKNPDNI